VNAEPTGRDPERLARLLNEIVAVGERLGRPPSKSELRLLMANHGVTRDELEDVLRSRPEDGYADDVDESPGQVSRITDLAPGSPPRGTSIGEVAGDDPEDQAHALPVVPVAGAEDRLVTRTVDDLIDDWHRAGGRLGYEDVTRLASKRGLRAGQLAAVLTSLGDAGVDVDGSDGNASASDDGEVSEDTEGSLSDRDIVGTYLRAIGKFDLLRPEDEVRLGRAIKAGQAADELLEAGPQGTDLQQLIAISKAGRSAHAELVRANLRLVVSIAKAGRYRLSGVEFIDRIQDGNVGLMRAADKFDPTLGYKFSTYATWWIRQSIDRGIADRGRLVRIPVHLHEDMLRVLRSKFFLERKLGREATVDEIAEAANVKTGAVAALLELSAPIRSIDSPIGADGDLTLGDLLSEKAEIDGRVDPYECARVSALHRDLEKFMTEVLSEREREVIKRRFGMVTGEIETLEAIGRGFQVSRERIRQIEKEAMKKLAGHSQPLLSHLVESDHWTIAEQSPSTSARKRKHRNKRQAATA
jgi:RNA polymerase primary sigma factor